VRPPKFNRCVARGEGLLGFDDARGTQRRDEAAGEEAEAPMMRKRLAKILDFIAYLLPTRSRSWALTALYRLMRCTSVDVSDVQSLVKVHTGARGPG